MEKKVPLYRQLAKELEDQIESGVFIPGEKLPSVRNLAQARQISVVTILKAYQILEQKGLIHPLPKSGYYISFHAVQSNSRAEVSKRAVIPQEVHISDLIRNYTSTSKRNDETGFLGTGLPGRDIVPINQLNRIMTRELRREDLQQLAAVRGEGYDLFRTQLVKYLYLKELSAAKDHLLVTNGCTEGIFICLNVLCRPGDQIVMQSPCSFGILQMAETMKIRVLEVLSDDKDGLDIDHLRHILDNYEVQAVYLNPNINNPLGTILSPEAKKQIAELVNRKKVFLIEDDVMSDLYFGTEQPVPIKAFDTDGYVIYCSSFTKTLLPTYRVGWVYSERLIDRIIPVKKGINVGTPLLQQAVLAELLESGNYSRCTRKARKIYEERTLKLRNDMLTNFPAGTRISMPQGGYLLWTGLPSGTDAAAYYEKLRSENIFVLPGRIFSLNDRYIDHFRVNAANYSESLKPLIVKMGRMAKAYL